MKIDEPLIQMIMSTYGLYGAPLLIILVAVIKSKDPLHSFVSLIGKITGLFKVNKKDKSAPPSSVSPRVVLLSRLDYLINFRINKLKLTDPGREVIFRDLLIIKFRFLLEYSETLQEFISEDMDTREMFRVIISRFNDAIDKYETEAVNSGIPRAVIIKYAEWRTGSYDYMLRCTKMIVMCDTGMSTDNKLDSIYSILNAMLDITIIEAERGLSELNGSLTGIEYKGVICG